MTRQMSVEQMIKGRKELLDLGPQLNEDLVEYAAWVGIWAVRVTDKYKLSNEALSMLLKTAPEALTKTIASYGEPEK